MNPCLQEVSTTHTADTLAASLQGEPGRVVLASGTRDAGARFSFVTARPFLTLRTHGARCEIQSPTGPLLQFGNPWQVLDRLMVRYELVEESGWPFPLGGCFGYWGYDLKNFIEPTLCPHAVNDLDLPDCAVGFHHSLVVFEQATGRAWVVATGLDAEGCRDPRRAQTQAEFWKERLSVPPPLQAAGITSTPAARSLDGRKHQAVRVGSTFSQSGFLTAIERAQAYIRAGDIYQVNLSQRFDAPWTQSGWMLYRRLANASPAPFAAYLDAGDFELASSSPELFLRLNGRHILTRPIKGTRPRSPNPALDAALAQELQHSPKERAELVMITDLLRNDLGRVCDYGTVQVPELTRWEPFAQVHHLVSTVQGILRPGTTHFAALSACFPGGSITGAPKFRAMQIIDELEPVTRGPYTGCLGYLGFNRETQLSIVIRSALCRDQRVWWHVGAGIVADSDPAAEYEETLAKGSGIVSALGLPDTTWLGHTGFQIRTERR